MIKQKSDKDNHKHTHTHLLFTYFSPAQSTHTQTCSLFTSSCTEAQTLFFNLLILLLLLLFNLILRHTHTETLHASEYTPPHTKAQTRPKSSSFSSPPHLASKNFNRSSSSSSNSKKRGYINRFLQFILRKCPPGVARKGASKANLFSNRGQPHTQSTPVIIIILFFFDPAAHNRTN